MSGSYYVLRAADGTVAKEIRCGEPILGSPIVAGERVYFDNLSVLGQMGPRSAE